MTELTYLFLLDTFVFSFILCLALLVVFCFTFVLIDSFKFLSLFRPTFLRFIAIKTIQI